MSKQCLQNVDNVYKTLGLRNCQDGDFITECLGHKSVSLVLEILFYFLSFHIFTGASELYIMMGFVVMYSYMHII